MANGDFTLSISLNGTTTSGRSENMSITKQFTGVTQTINQEIVVGTSDIDIFKIGSSAGAGQLVSPVKCIIIKNLEETNDCTIGLIDDSAKAFYTVIKEGEAFVLCDNTIDTNVTGGAVGTLTNIDRITAQFNTGTSNKIELLVIK